MKQVKSNKDMIEEFDKTEFVDEELVDKISLWMLRIILKLGGDKNLIDKRGNLYSRNIAYFLGIGKYVNIVVKEFERGEIFDTLKSNYFKLEERKEHITSSKILTKNIHQISRLVGLSSTEEKILEFFILLKHYDILNDASDLLGELNNSRFKRAISTILDISLTHVDNALSSKSKLIKSSIITISKKNRKDLNSRIEFFSDSFASSMLSVYDDISFVIKDIVRSCDKSTLKLEDYQHISKDIEIIVSYLKSAIKSKKKGVNVLFYGSPGTGKTELAKAISEALETKLYEVTYANEYNRAITGVERLRAFNIAQQLLSNHDMLLMFDEVEDVFSVSHLSLHNKPNSKAWINRILETNSIPTIWITNDIWSIDDAYIRRFDFCLEASIPNRSKRAEIIKNHSNGLLDEHSIKILSESENLAPAIVTRAIKVVKSIDTEDKAKALTLIINNTLKAQGYQEIYESALTQLPNVYNPKFINTTVDLEALTKGIKEHQNARICLYGPAGTGKSAFGRYIAQSIDKPLILKKGSDLLSMWVGGTEENIAEAFKEAKAEKAILLFDEVDSFLADRTGAHRSWEITQVNEMLVQMENFEGIFIATTNLMDNLDKASLRRFDLKLEFGYLTSKQSWDMFKVYSKSLNLPTPHPSLKRAIGGLRYLTPGDFAAVARQNRFRPIEDIEDFIKRLEDEVTIKSIANRSVMGFL